MNTMMVGEIRHRELKSDFLLVKVPNGLDWVPFRDVFEVDGVPEAVARESLRLAATKLPIRTRFISRLATDASSRCAATTGRNLVARLLGRLGPSRLSGREDARDCDHCEKSSHVAPPLRQ